jgi:hypothetical protein
MKRGKGMHREVFCNQFNVVGSALLGTVERNGALIIVFNTLHPTSRRLLRELNFMRSSETSRFY